MLECDPTFVGKVTLYLAMSCLQGRTMHSAFDDLAQLHPDGIQLTPGNAPTVGFMSKVEASTHHILTHQGFTPLAMRTRVWTDEQLNGQWDSVHPPRLEPSWQPAEKLRMQIIEIMYPGRPLGRGEDVERAMREGQRLAVDVSHVHIQRQQGAMTLSTWRRLQDYEHIGEVHVSDNDGSRDQHRTISKDTFGLDWARERAVSGVPVILESYMHKKTRSERLQQLDLVRGHA